MSQMLIQTINKQHSKLSLKVANDDSLRHKLNQIECKCTIFVSCVGTEWIAIFMTHFILYMLSYVLVLITLIQFSRCFFYPISNGSNCYKIRRAIIMKSGCTWRNHPHNKIYCKDNVYCKLLMEVQKTSIWSIDKKWT